jgi:hypothetical protein
MSLEGVGGQWQIGGGRWCDEQGRRGRTAGARHGGGRRRRDESDSEMATKGHVAGVRQSRALRRPRDGWSRLRVTLFGSQRSRCKIDGILFFSDKLCFRTSISRLLILDLTIA